MRIKTIYIKNYKAFYSPSDSHLINVDSKNLFVYGENGSGKSSFYYALKDFFQSSVEAIPIDKLRNIYLNDGKTDCSVVVDFTDGTQKQLSDLGKDTDTPEIKDANRLKSFITYKHLLAVHNIKIDKRINVFDLLVKGVLKHFKASFSGGIELGELWEDVVTESRKTTGQGGDFYFKHQKKSSVEKKAVKFNAVLNALFLKPEPPDTNVEYLGPDVNRILKYFFPEIKIEFSRHTIKVDNEGHISQSKVLLDIEYKGIDLENLNPQFILNEAKLSAIAISMFLGTILKRSPYSPQLKPLFLDDVLIGLDNTNRLKLLKVLKNEFSNFQIFITTYDRHWYEIAKLNANNVNWKFVEFYRGKNGPEINVNLKSYLEKAKIYFDSFEYPECANNLRKECENLFKDKLLQTYTYGEGIKSHVKPLKLESLIDRLSVYYTNLGLEPPQSLLDSLYTYKSILFNPLSHDDIDSPIYKEDLEKAFKVIQDLKDIQMPSRTILVNKGTIFTLDLPAIQYQAQIELAKNIYSVNNNGAKTISPVSVFFKDWTRAGVRYAKPIGNPVTAMEINERLTKLKDSEFSIAKATIGLNTTFTDRSIPEISSEDVLKNMTLSGTALFSLLNPTP